MNSLYVSFVVLRDRKVTRSMKRSLVVATLLPDSPPYAAEESELALDSLEVLLEVPRVLTPSVLSGRVLVFEDRYA